MFDEEPSAAKTIYENGRRHGQVLGFLQGVLFTGFLLMIAAVFEAIKAL